MAHRRRAAARRSAALLSCCALLLGCAGGAAGGAGAGLSAASSSGRDRFEGRYEGHRLPPADAAFGGTCRARSRPVRFEVKNGIIEMRTERGRAANRRKAELWGAVSTDGEVAMRPASGNRTVAGRIEGDRLTAADVQDPQALAQAAAQGGRVPCLYRYEATRVGSPRSAPRRGGDAPGAGGAPPVEGLPQP